jgi:hypothetical protein
LIPILSSNNNLSSLLKNTAFTGQEVPVKSGLIANSSKIESTLLPNSVDVVLFSIYLSIFLSAAVIIFLSFTCSAIVVIKSIALLKYELLSLRTPKYIPPPQPEVYGIGFHPAGPPG